MVLGAGTVSEVAAATGRDPRVISAAIRRLTAGGLVSAQGGRPVPDTAAFKQAVRDAAPSQPVAQPLDPDPAKAAVLRAFIRHGMLTALPAAHGKRRVVLEHIAAAFEPGVRYPERTVDAVLRAWYDDHATLRRYLVDEQLLAREAGVYWRIGGPVPI